MSHHRPPAWPLRHSFAQYMPMSCTFRQDGVGKVAPGGFVLFNSNTNQHATQSKKRLLWTKSNSAITWSNHKRWTGAHEPTNGQPSTRLCLADEPMLLHRSVLTQSGRNVHKPRPTYLSRPHVNIEALCHSCCTTRGGSVHNVGRPTSLVLTSLSRHYFFDQVSHREGAIYTQTTLWVNPSVYIALTLMSRASTLRRPASS